MCDVKVDVFAFLHALSSFGVSCDGAECFVDTEFVSDAFVFDCDEDVFHFEEEAGTWCVTDLEEQTFVHYFLVFFVQYDTAKVLADLYIQFCPAQNRPKSLDLIYV